MLKDKQKHISRNDKGEGLLDEEIKENKRFNKKQILAIFMALLVVVYTASAFISPKTELKNGFYQNGDQVMKVEDGVVEIKEYYYNEETQQKEFTKETKTYEINVENGTFIIEDSNYYIKNEDIFTRNQFWEYLGVKND